MALRRTLALGVGGLCLAACQAQPLPGTVSGASAGAKGPQRQLQSLSLGLRLPGLGLCVGLGRPCPKPSATPSAVPSMAPSVEPSATPSDPRGEVSVAPSESPSTTPVPVLPGHITGFAVDPQGQLFLFGLDAGVSPEGERPLLGGRVVRLAPGQAPQLIDDLPTEVGQADSGRNTLNFYTSGTAQFSAWKRFQYRGGALEAGELLGKKAWHHHAVGTMRPSDERFFVSQGDEAPGGAWDLVEQFGQSASLVTHGPGHLRPTGFSWTGARPVWASAGGLATPGANASAAPQVLDPTPIFSLVADGPSAYLATTYGLGASQDLVRLVPGQGATPVLHFAEGHPYRLHVGGDGKRYLMSTRQQGDLLGRQAGDAGVRIHELLQGPDGGISLAPEALFATF